MRFLVLVNPSSNGGRAGRRWKLFENLLPEADFVLLSNIDEAHSIAKDAMGFEAVVACGGDGTVNAVADGVMANPNKTLHFGVLYMGTSPDFCRFHGIPTEPKAAAQLLLSGKAKEVPVLMANGHCFFCSCNIGMGADVASFANLARPILGDRLGTFVSLVRSIVAGRRYNVRINGEVITDCSHLLFSRMPYIAGGMKIQLPELKDDEYAMWLVRSLSFMGWLRLLPKIYTGSPCGECRICGGCVTVTSEDRIQVEYDGDPHGELPLEITFAKQKLKLIAPCGMENDNA